MATTRIPLEYESTRRCPYDGKRLVVDVGPDEGLTDPKTGKAIAVYECLHCGYREHGDAR